MRGDRNPAWRKRLTADAAAAPAPAGEHEIPPKRRQNEVELVVPQELFPDDVVHGLLDDLLVPLIVDAVIRRLSQE